MFAWGAHNRFVSPFIAPFNKYLIECSEVGGKRVTFPNGSWELDQVSLFFFVLSYPSVLLANAIFSTCVVGPSCESVIFILWHEMFGS